LRPNRALKPEQVPPSHQDQVGWVVIERVAVAMNYERSGRDGTMQPLVDVPGERNPTALDLDPALAMQWPAAAALARTHAGLAGAGE
jgi:hypothetical protein